MKDAGVWKIQNKIMDNIREEQAKPSRCIDVTEHAKILRRELKKKFPDIKFRVLSERFAGGQSVRVYHCGIKIDYHSELYKEITQFVDQFDGGDSDLMDGHYNIGFDYEGERLVGAKFCRYHGRHWKDKS
jgi:hypothetical protein